MIKVNAKSPNHLRKNLGMGFGLAIGIGGTIGIGILRTPGHIAGLIPNFWLILLCWTIGGFIVMLAAISYAELATMIPKAGGSFNYVKRAFGNYSGFLVGWFQYIGGCAASAFFCIVISEYILLLFPGIIIPKTNIAVCILSLFTAMHLTGIKTGSLLIQVTSLIKVILFGVLVGACFLLGGQPASEMNHTEKAAPIVYSGSLILSFFKALQFVIGAYNGWWSITVFAEENLNPGRNIPKALFVGIFIILLIYVLTNAALFFVVPIPEAANSTLVASNAATKIFGNSVSIFLLVFALLSVLSILNTGIMIPSRILFGLSREGLFFPRGAYINRGGTPAVAMIFSFIFQLVLVLASSFEGLFALGAYLSIIITTFAMAAVIKLRSTEPDLLRPYHTVGYPYTTIISIIILVLVFFGFVFNDQKSLFIIAIIVLVSYPCFILLKKNYKNGIIQLSKSNG